MRTSTFFRFFMGGALVPCYYCVPATCRSLFFCKPLMYLVIRCRSQITVKWRVEEEGGVRFDSVPKWRASGWRKRLWGIVLETIEMKKLLIFEALNTEHHHLFVIIPATIYHHTASPLCIVYPLDRGAGSPSGAHTSFK